MIPNSPPPKGRNVSTPDAPTRESDETRNEPHAAHPSPKTPLATPRNPGATPLCPTSRILLFKKYVIMPMYIPKSIAIAIVYEAERSVKLVAIDPKRAIGKATLLTIDISSEPITFVIKSIFGNQTASTKENTAILSASMIYAGFRYIFCKASIIIFISLEVQYQSTASPKYTAVHQREGTFSLLRQQQYSTVYRFHQLPLHFEHGLLPSLQTSHLRDMY